MYFEDVQCSQRSQPKATLSEKVDNTRWGARFA